MLEGYVDIAVSLKDTIDMINLVLHFNADILLNV